MRVATLNGLEIRRRLGRDTWRAPKPYGLDGWTFVNGRGGSIVISVARHDDGVDWIHASIARTDWMPDYRDLQLLHRAVFEDRWAYQVFAPPADHINIHALCLHLCGRLDGQPVLPNFGAGGSI